MSEQGTMSRDDIIAQARELVAPTTLESLVGVLDDETDEMTLVETACKAFMLDGRADEQTGDVSTFGHYARVHRWIIWANGTGQTGIDEEGSEREAINRFSEIESEYADWREDAQVDE